MHTVSWRCSPSELFGDQFDGSIQSKILVFPGYPRARIGWLIPLTSTPSNDAFVRNNAWAAYNANLHQIPTTTNPNRFGCSTESAGSKSVHPEANSAHRYNFQFSDNEIRSCKQPFGEWEFIRTGRRDSRT